jgi:hypothetical protein
MHTWPTPLMARTLARLQRVCHGVRLGIALVLAAYMLALALRPPLAAHARPALGGSIHATMTANQLARFERRFCRSGPKTSPTVSVRGFFIESVVTGLADTPWQGAIFADDRIPVSAAYYSQWNRFSGVSVEGKTHAGGIPNGQWVIATGQVVCGPLGRTLRVSSWHRTTPAHVPPLATVPGLLEVQELPRFCATRPRALYQITVSGWFVAQVAPWIDAGVLFGKPPTSTRVATELARQPGIHTVPAARGDFSKGPMPSGSHIVVHGIIDCVRAPHQLEIIAWSTAAP